MASAFTESFEGGSTGTTLTTSNTSYTSITTPAVFDSSKYKLGAQSAKFTSSDSASAGAKVTFTSTTTRYFRRYFILNNVPTTGANILTLVRTSLVAATTAQVVVASDGTITLRNANTNVATATNKVPVGIWFRVEWMVDSTSTTQTLKLFLGGAVDSTTPTETISGSYTQGNFDRVTDGAGSAAAGTVWVDAVNDDTATYPGPASGGTAIPTANAGTNQTVTTSSVVTLNGTASSDSNSGGLITTYAWTQISGIAVTLSSSSASQPTFTAPASTGTLVFSLLVTDNKNLQSLASTVTITVQTPTAGSFSETFEAGTNGATLTTSNTAYSLIGTPAVFDSSTKIAGSLSAKLSSDGTVSPSLREVLTSSASSRYFRRYFRFDALPGSSSVNIIMRLKLSSTTVAEVVLGTSGSITIRDGTATTVATSTTLVSVNSWLRIEWFVDSAGTTQTARLYTGTYVNTTTITETLTGSYSGGSFDRIEDGFGSTGTVGNMWVDEVADSPTTWPGPASGSNQSPTANAGPDQAVSPAATVTLDGTASSDPDGTIASYSWRQISGTTVSLSSTTVARPTFTAPATGTLVFGLTVTDNLGASSSEDTVVITLNLLFFESFESGSNGAAITTSNTTFGTISNTAATGIFTTTRANGMLAAMLSVGGTAGSYALNQTLSSSVSARVMQRYYLFQTLPATNTIVTLIRLLLSGTTVAQLVLNSSGTLGLRNTGNVTVATSTYVVPLNNWIRIHWSVDTTAGTQTCTIFSGKALEGMTATATLAGSYSGGNFGTVKDGIGTSTTNFTMYLDSVADAASGTIAPRGTQYLNAKVQQNNNTMKTGVPKVYQSDGTWRNGHAKAWNGSAWV